MNKWDYMEWEDAGLPIETQPTEKLAFAYAVLSVAYYEEYSPLVSDYIYDAVCFALKSRNDLPDWVGEEDLDAGTGYDSSKFPKEVKPLCLEIIESKEKNASSGPEDGFFRFVNG